jgi:adenylate cyclase
MHLWNLSRKVPAALASGEVIAPGEHRDVSLPVHVTVGQTQLQIEQRPAWKGLKEEEDQEAKEDLRTVARPFRLGEAPDIARLARDMEAIGPETLARWFEAVISVQLASASSDEFYRQTAQAVVGLVGLDLGMVLLKRENRWEVIAEHSTGHEASREYSNSILERVCRERRTFYNGITDAETTASLSGVLAVVAAPIFGGDEEVIGIVYGTRSRRPNALALIRPLEAQLVQVLAAAVAAGLARLKSEADAARRLVQFEQFFTAELARELDLNPSLLDGREKEITILFSDIRGFSRLSEQLDPREVCQLAADVMDCQSALVREHGGSVVNYSGDGMLAMWNAPGDQPDHAIRACRAALAMNGELASLDARWRARIGRPVQVGIGVNTGRALVGNTGSRTKFMYGPQGHSVNLASRVEGATKQLGVPILITGSTQASLGNTFATRRICRVRVVGIDGAVDLYELHAGQPSSDWCRFRDAYEAGLRAFESRQWLEAYSSLNSLLTGQGKDLDLPTLSLIGRCVECLKAPPTSFDPVIELGHK